MKQYRFFYKKYELVLKNYKIRLNYSHSNILLSYFMPPYPHYKMDLTITKKIKRLSVCSVPTPDGEVFHPKAGLLALIVKGQTAAKSIQQNFGNK